MPGSEPPPLEIERKFLVADESWRDGVVASKRIRQGYLESGEALTIRVRVANGDAFLTIKSGEAGSERLEFEYPIPKRDAELLLDRYCRKPLIEKVRYEAPFHGAPWTVDVFEGAQAGLVLAEIELEKIDAEFARPAWLGEEVTGDSSYRNSNL